MNGSIRNMVNYKHRQFVRGDSKKAVIDGGSMVTIQGREQLQKPPENQAPTTAATTVVVGDGLDSIKFASKRGAKKGNIKLTL